MFVMQAAVKHKQKSLSREQQDRFDKAHAPKFKRTSSPVKCSHRSRLAPSRLKLFEGRSRRNERRSREETTCLACMNSNLICILLAGNYCDDVSKINGSWMNFWKDEFRRISLSLLHFCTVLHYFNPYTYIGVKYQRESCGRQPEKTTKANFRQKKSSSTKSSI